MFLFNKEGRGGGGGAQSQIGAGFFFSFFFLFFFLVSDFLPFFAFRSCFRELSCALAGGGKSGRPITFLRDKMPPPLNSPRCSSSLKSDCHIHFLPCCGISGIRHAPAFRIIVFRSTVDGDRTCSHSPAAAGTPGASGLIPNRLTGFANPPPQI